MQAQTIIFDKREPIAKISANSFEIVMEYSKYSRKVKDLFKKTFSSWPFQAPPPYKDPPSPMYRLRLSKVINIILTRQWTFSGQRICLSLSINLLLFSAAFETCSRTLCDIVSPSALLLATKWQFRCEIDWTLFRWELYTVVSWQLSTHIRIT